MSEANAQPTRLGPGRSCTACRSRKIRCDQQQPCGNCGRSQRECIYGTPIKAASKPSPDCIATRLTNIESILQRIDAKVSDPSSKGSSNRPERISSRHANSEAKAAEGRFENGRFVSEEGDTRYVTGNLWTELDERRGATDFPPQGRSQPIRAFSSQGDTQQPTRNASFPLGLDPDPAETRSLHPPVARIVALWQVFVDSVDPVLKIIHVPTTQQQLVAASEDLSKVPASFECLMFAIYYGAICSMQWSVSHETFPIEERHMLLDRYRVGFERACTKARLLSAPNVTTIQALAIWITCARQHVEKAYIWTMTGLLVRLAMKLGLHHDPISLDISLFASEMRRRLWYTIVTLDILVAEANDTEPSSSDQIYDTKFPASLDDANLYRDMTSIPPEDLPSLDMLFSFARLEYTTTSYKVVYPPRHPHKPTPTLQERNDMIDQLGDRIESKYLPPHTSRTASIENLPIVFLARNTTKLIVAKTKLAINCPPRSQIPTFPREKLNALIRNATDIVRFAHELRSDKRYSHWIWLFDKCIEWDAVAFLLQIMRTIPLGERVHVIWNVMETFFKYWSEWIPMAEPRWCLLQSLRRDAAAKQGMTLPSPDRRMGHPLQPSFRDHDEGTMTVDSFTTTPTARYTDDSTMQEDTDTMEASDDSTATEPTQMDETPKATAQQPQSASSSWTFDDTLYSTPGPVDWNMYFNDDTIATAYFDSRFSRSG